VKAGILHRFIWFVLLSLTIIVWAQFLPALHLWLRSRHPEGAGADDRARPATAQELHGLRHCRSGELLGRRGHADHPLVDPVGPHEAHPAYWAPFVVVREGSSAMSREALGAAAGARKKLTTRKSMPNGQADWKAEFLRH
jgi:hypothetical protein